MGNISGDPFAKLNRVYYATHVFDESIEGPFQEALLDLFRNARVPAVLIGGLAVAYYSEEPLSTNGVDVLVATPEQMEALAGQIGIEFDRVGVYSFSHRKTQIAVDVLTFQAGGDKVFKALEDPVGQVMSGVTVKIARPEWIIALKLERGIRDDLRGRRDQVHIITLLKDAKPDIGPIMPFLTRRERKRLEELRQVEA